ncbi:MAG: hypothetical protein OSB05_07990 [Akkermansiaceae bacterium]|nr:hypothetical protein [Akkermansiaceae bacterium]
MARGASKRRRPHRYPDQESLHLRDRIFLRSFLDLIQVHAHPPEAKEPAKGGDRGPAGTDPADVRESTVAFTTSDNIVIQGALRLPAARIATKLPAVILIHQGGRSRAEWKLNPAAVSMGCVVPVFFVIEILG